MALCLPIISPPADGSEKHRPCEIRGGQVRHLTAEVWARDDYEHKKTI